MAVSCTARRRPRCSSKARSPSGRPSSAPGYAGYIFGATNPDEESSTERQQLEALPQTDANGRATFDVSLAKVPNSSRPQEAKIFIRMAESGGRAVERNLVLPIAPKAAMIGIKPLFVGRSVGEGENANFDVVFVAPDGTSLARDGLRYELLKLESRYQWYRRGSYWDYEPVKSTSASPTAISPLSPASRRAYRPRRRPAAIASTSRAPRPMVR